MYSSALDSWTELEQADVALAPSNACAWTLEIYNARKNVKALRIYWQCLWQRLGIQANDPAAQTLLLSIYELGMQVADMVEHDMEQTFLPYHNSTHICDVMVLCAHLLDCWKAGCTTHQDATVVGPPWCAQSAACLMLAALCHDWGHDGNPTPVEPTLEARARAKLDQCWPTKSGAALADWLSAQKTTGLLILATEHKTASALHRHYAEMSDGVLGQASMQDWLALLLTEADIGASLLPHLGWELSARVRQEQVNWNQQQGLSCAQTQPVDIESLRIKFLAHAHISSSCAHHLGLPVLANLSHRLSSA